MLQAPLRLTALAPTLALALGLVVAAPGPARAEEPWPPATPAVPAPVAARVPYTVKGPQGERSDDYHWLRDDDPKAKRPEVMRHLQAENDHTESVMQPLAGLRQALVAEMRSRLKEDDSSVPAWQGGWWWWNEFRPGEDHPRRLRQRGGPQGPDAGTAPELVLDGNARATGHAYFRISSQAVSPDGRWLAWTEDTSGRNIHTLYFKDLDSGRVLPEVLPGVMEGVAWASDGHTLFYLRQDAVTLNSGPVMRHRLGSDPAGDVQVFEEPDKTRFVSLARSASGRYVLVAVGDYDSSETFTLDAAHPEAPVRRLLARRAGVRHEADHLGHRWTIRTNEEAVDFRLVSAPETAPDDRRRWRTVLPARAQVTLERFVLMKTALAVQERSQVDSRVRVLRQGRWLDLPAPAATSVTLAANDDADAAWLRYQVESMVQPARVYDLHLARGNTVLRKQRAVPGYEAERYATTRTWARARDGVQIPVTLAWRPDRARRDASAPLLVTGYGAYGLCYDVDFSSQLPSLLDRGFVVAIAHVRGGAELGQAWYEAGRLMHKKNSFNDFIDATRMLLQQGWGDPRRVFALGGSAGGLLMGAVANQEPGLWRGMVLEVPFVDVVTTMLDASIPLTANEWTQWGDPREKAAYDYLLSYSPYDGLRAQRYPAMLVTTGLWDGQVQYYEPAKYVARLRALKTDTNPLLLQVNMNAGHGGSAGRFAVLDEVALKYAFLIGLAQSRP